MDESGYGKDFYQGMPVITKNDYGKGRAYYLATASSKEFYQEFLSNLCREQGIWPVLETPAGVEVTSRENESERLIYVLNHNSYDVEINLPGRMEDLISEEVFETGEKLVLQPKDVKILSMDCNL